MADNDTKLDTPAVPFDPRAIAKEVAKLLDAKLDITERKRSAELYVHLQSMADKISSVHEELVRMGVKVDVIQEGFQGLGLRITAVEGRTGALESKTLVIEQQVTTHGSEIMRLDQRNDRHSARLAEVDGRSVSGIHDVQEFRRAMEKEEQRVAKEEEHAVAAGVVKKATRWKMATVLCAFGMLILALIASLQRCSSEPQATSTHHNRDAAVTAPHTRR